MIHNFKTHSDFIGVLRSPDTTSISIESGNIDGFFLTQWKGDKVICEELLPSGTWQLLIPDAAKATPQQAATVVECISDFYPVYTSDDRYDFILPTELESLATLLLRERMYAVNPVADSRPILPVGRIEDVQVIHQKQMAFDYAQSRVGSWAICKRIK